MDAPRLLSRLAGEDISRDTLAMLEWQLLPLLHEPLYQPIALIEKLQNEPAFFVEVLAMMYRRRDEPPSAAVSVEDRSRAHAAFDLLHVWRRPPGVSTEGSIDERKLRNWLIEARRLAEAAGRADVADNHIGQVLAHLPQGPEGAWPPVLGELLEELRSTSVGDGLFSGLYNSRGVIHKGVFEGGDQERLLSEHYRRQADSVSFHFPRLARIFRRLADLYQSEATREDQSAELGL